MRLTSPRHNETLILSPKDLYTKKLAVLYIYTGARILVYKQEPLKIRQTDERQRKYKIYKDIKKAGSTQR